MLSGILSVLETEQLFVTLVHWFFSQQNSAALTPAESPLLPHTELWYPPALADQTLLKQLIPSELYREAMQSGVTGIHALSFALRLRVTHLQLMFHAASLAPVEFGFGTVSLDQELKLHLIEMWQDLFQSESWPLFGFSAVGVHMGLRPKGICRAFDAHSLMHCNKAAQPLFCEHHQQEAFWVSTRLCSKQAIMFEYYALPENFRLYDEQELNRMSQDFWIKMQRYRATQTLTLQAALQQFELENEGDLRHCGLPELRRRFLRLTLEHHPDRGGDPSSFIRLQSHYRQLKSFLDGDGALKVSK